MFINEIDKYIELQFTLVKSYLDEHKYSKKVKDTGSFIDYYQKIINQIDYSKILKNIKDDKNIVKIRNIIEKYILFYLLLNLCIKEDNLYDEDEKLFVEKLFNVSNSLPIIDSVAIGDLVEIYQSYYICLTLLKFLKEKKELTINETNKEIIELFNNIGIDTVQKYFDLKQNGLHNILLTLLVTKIYAKTDKIEIARINEENELVNADYKYIDIVEARIQDIDFASMEMLFDIESRKIGYPEDYYNLIQENKLIMLGDVEENLNPEYAIQSNLVSNDRKIGYLFHKKLLIPITDEILRYHVKEAKYESQQGGDKKENTRTNDTKLNYIVTKINNVIESARNPASKKLYYQPLFYRQAVPYNDIEEMKILKKFSDIGRVNAENVSSFNDLLSFRIYNYINYQDFAHFGFFHKHNYTTDALRYTNFRFRKHSNNTIKNKNDMQWRVITHDNFRINPQHNFNSAIVGVAFPKYVNFLPYDIRCLKISNSINVRRYNLNGYNITKDLLSKLIVENKIFNRTPFWIFDAKTDKFTQETYDDINNSNQQIFFKKLIANVYNVIEDLTQQRILKEFESNAPLTLYQSNQILDIITSRLVPIPIYSEKMANINFARYYTYLPQRLNIVDIKEITFTNKELEKLPVYKPPKNLKVNVISIEKKSSNQIDIFEDATCQHTITLNYIKRTRERDPTLFTKQLNDFFKQYVVDKINNNYICNSCSQFIDIDKYISEFGDLIKINAESRIPLEEQRRYEKFGKAINALDKIIERMGSIFNLGEYMGNTPPSILKRRETIRNLLDILLSSQDIRSKNPTDFDKDVKILEDVVGAKYSEYFAFPVENDIFVYSSRDTDKFKRSKYNTILTHIAVLMILDISIGSIKFFNTDKLINITIFDKYGLTTLDNLKLRINTANDLVYLGNYLLLGYVIYYMSSMMIRMKVYETEDPNIDVKKTIPPLDRLRIMHSIVHLLAIIIDRKNKTSDYLYEILANNYFIKLSNVFNTNSPDNFNASLNEIRYLSQKKIDNTPTKKLNTKKQIYYEIKGVLVPYVPFKSEFITETLNLNYYPNKKVIDNFKISENEMDEIVKRNLLKMYKRETSLLKLNIDATKLEKYDLKQVLEVRQKYINMVLDNIEKQRKELNINKIRIEKTISKLAKISEQLETSLLPFDELLNLFIDKMEKYIGDNQTIFKEDYYLRKSVFIINHDIYGIGIKPFKIDKITIKYNDSVTKSDVIIYREKSTERYYDIYSLAYLGYKDNNTDFVKVKNHQYLVIKHSLMDKIKYIGLYNRYINILPLEQQANYKFKYRGNVIYDDNELIHKIIVNKTNQDKILIEKFQRIIFSIRNKKEIKENKEEKIVLTKEQLIINEFLPRLQSLKVLSPDFTLFLQSWKKICFGFTVKPLKEIKIKDNYINSDDINENNNYNVLIRYLLVQLINLIEMNNDKVNINLCSLIAIIFDNMWEEYEVKNNYEINKFLLLLYTGVEDYLISLSGVADVVGEDPVTPEDIANMTDEQKEKLSEQAEDDKEREDAIDYEPPDPEDLDMGEQELIMDDRENE